jgi:hypothetical protein
MTHGGNDAAPKTVPAATEYYNTTFLFWKTPLYIVVEINFDHKI